MEFIGAIMILLILGGIFAYMLFMYIWNSTKNKSPYIPKTTLEATAEPEQITYIEEHPYMPYTKKKLCTKTEYAFYNVLVKEAAKRHCLVCPKVRLEDLVNITDRRNHMRYRGYVKSRHVDFVVTDIQLNPLMAIELDDPSHKTLQAQRTDAFKNELFYAIKLPLVRICTGANYNEELVKVFEHLKIPVYNYQTKTPAKQQEMP